MDRPRLLLINPDAQDVAQLMTIFGRDCWQGGADAVDDDDAQVAGAVWCAGTVFNFISAGMVGVAISVGIGSGAPMIGALWGVFVWHEFADGSAVAKAYIGATLVLYAAGVTAMALAYTL